MTTDADVVLELPGSRSDSHYIEDRRTSFRLTTALQLDQRVNVKLLLLVMGQLAEEICQNWQRKLLFSTLMFVNHFC